MSGAALCQFNQSGHCKYKLECRKRHADKLCPEDKCKSKECSLRHPKVCKYYSRDEICHFKEDCSYKHVKHSEKDMKVKDNIKQNTENINAITIEKNKMKEMVAIMEDQITLLKQELESSKKTNVAEIVELVVSLLDNQKASAKPAMLENKNKTEKSKFCDICDFESESKAVMTSHMSDEHEDSYTCYLCDKYFITKNH